MPSKNESSLEILHSKFTTFQTVHVKENSSQTLFNQLQTSFGNYLPLPVPGYPKKKRIQNRVGEFALMMQKHYKVQVPVDSMQAKRFKAKRTLEQKKESKHPSSPKKRCTED